MRFQRSVTSLALFALFTLAATGRAQVTPQTEMVAMRDGVKLATDVYIPKGQGPFGTVLVRTPYGRKVGGGFVAMALGLQGYATVVQDVRGRFDSEGHHAIVFGNEGLGEHQDGHDTMNWVTKQPWCNGKIVTWGGSALGITQNMAAPDAPASLVGQVVQVAFCDYYRQAAYQGGVWRTELLEKWLEGTKMTDVNLPTFLAHPYHDDFWKKLDAQSRAAKVNAPGIFMGGWYDIFNQGTINSFVTIQNQGGPLARGKCYLVMGPLAHGTFTELKYPANSTKPPIDAMNPVPVFAAWLKGQTGGIAKLKPVNYYVMGDTTDPKAPGNVWRSEEVWPPPADVTPFYLHADGTLQRGGSDKVSGTAAVPDTLSYKYDPANPVPTIGGQNLTIAKGPMDQKAAEKRPDVLVFSSPVLTEPVEVTGQIFAKLYVASDCPDTDFTVKLTDVYPDGRSMLVTDGIRRASLRKGFEKPEFLKPGEVVEVEVDLWSTSLIFNKGHQIRIAISSSNSPRFEPNANTGEPHPAPGKTRVASNTLYLSKDRPSHVLLPIYKGTSAK